MTQLPPGDPAGRAKARLAFALDYADFEAARAAIALVGPHVGCLKVGLELFVRLGPAIVQAARASGAQVFLDLKLHDIAETVERAVGSAASVGVDYLTVHASGGPAMLERAARRAEAEGHLKLLAVTVLTSLDQGDLARTGVSDEPGNQVLRLARLARECGIPGLVSSAQEVASLRAAVGPEMFLCTPGIRPAGSALGDQKRVSTPADAIRDGADLLVVGRPIRDAAEPLSVVHSLLQEMSGALGAGAVS